MLKTVETPERSATRAGGQAKRKDALSARPSADHRAECADDVTAADFTRIRRGLSAPESLEHANRPLAPRTSARGLRCEGEGAASDVDHRYEIEGAASGAGFSQTHDH